MLLVLLLLEDVELVGGGFGGGLFWFFRVVINFCRKVLSLELMLVDEMLLLEEVVVVDVIEVVLVVELLRLMFSVDKIFLSVLMRFLFLLLCGGGGGGVFMCGVVLVEKLLVLDNVDRLVRLKLLDDMLLMVMMDFFYCV